MFFYRASPDVRAVVFIATPHRGCELALTPLGALGRLLGRAPVKVARKIDAFSARNTMALADPRLRDDGSILGLSPRNPLVQALAEMPMNTRRTRLYTVVGNRGRPGPLADSSDGVVRYASSHLPQAREEVVVPFGHSGTLKAPGTATEVERVLRLLP